MGANKTRRIPPPSNTKTKTTAKTMAPRWVLKPPDLSSQTWQPTEANQAIKKLIPNKPVTAANCINTKFSCWV
ncbi:MAG: hypothetical protein GY780_01680 [bacterium]|nr:hypothetical protein [bacterium]